MLGGKAVWWEVAGISAVLVEETDINEFHSVQHNAPSIRILSDFKCTQPVLCTQEQVGSVRTLMKHLSDTAHILPAKVFFITALKKMFEDNREFFVGTKSGHPKFNC